jgi:hypothetical protein
MSKRHIVITISYRAMVARIMRALKAKGQRLAVDRRAHDNSHFIVDDARQMVVARDVDLGELARELEVLKPWEQLEA